MLHEFVQKSKDMMAEEINGIHTAFPGTIVAVDTVTGLATVRPTIKYVKPDGERIDYPQISGVPILFPQGGGQGASIAFPVRENDGCLIVIAEQSLDFWLYGMETGTDLKFDMTNAICIPGLFQRAPGSLAVANSTNSIVLQNGGVSLVVGSGGITINGSLTVNGSITGSSVRAGGVSLSSHTHNAPADGGQTSGPS